MSEEELEAISYLRRVRDKNLFLFCNDIRIVLNLITKQQKELETWKKIAEKLADEVKKEVVFYDSEGINFCEVSNAEFGKCFKHNNGASCKECIIDWARKEVENES